MRRNAVVGQTGRIVLSDHTLRYKIDKKRTIRFGFKKVKGGWMAQVTGPFHSRLYGVTGLGYCGPITALTADDKACEPRKLSGAEIRKRAKTSAKAALKARLADDFGYIGHLMFSDHDEADNVGDPNPRLSEEGARNIPITKGR